MRSWDTVLTGVRTHAHTHTHARAHTHTPHTHTHHHADTQTHTHTHTHTRTHTHSHSHTHSHILPSTGLVLLTSGQKHIKQNLQVLRSSLCLWMELNAKKRPTLVDNTLIGSVVGVGEQIGPTSSETRSVYSKAVVLCSDEAPQGVRSPLVDTRLVVTTVAIPTRQDKAGRNTTSDTHASCIDI